jgi:hypothetical protein
MKKNVLLALLVILSATAGAQVQVGINYGYSLPAGDMKQHLNRVHNFAAEAMYFIPATRNKLGVGIEWRYGNYASLTREQTYVFTDGSSTRTDVRFNSNISNINLSTRYNIAEKNGFIPYLSLKGGYQLFYTSVYVEDPADPGDCIPLEEKNVFKDHTFSASLGAGLQVDLQRLFKKMPEDYCWLNFSTNYTLGGNLRYLNVRNMQDHNHVSGTNDAKPDDFTIRFVNVTTQNIHEHKVAQVHQSPIQLLEFRVGFAVRLCNRR